jgi:hypothetical protein
MKCGKPEGDCENEGVGPWNYTGVPLCKEHNEDVNRAWDAQERAYQERQAFLDWVLASHRDMVAEACYEAVNVSKGGYKNEVCCC